MPYQPETLAIHAGQVVDPATNARAVPIYATTSYVFNSTDHAANLFGLREFGNIYTRIMNPTNDVFEKRVAELEGGIAALAVASGQAAETLTVLNLARAGDNLVSSQTLYGGTYNLFEYTLPKWGIRTRFVDIHNLESVRAAIDAGTRLLYVETIGNPAPRRAELRGAGRDRARRRHSARGGQHLRRRHARPPDPVRRRHRRPLGHQVDRRPWHGDRRRRGGRRQVRLEQPGSPQARSPNSAPPTRRITAWCTPRRSATSRSSSSCGSSCCATSGPALSPWNAFLFLQGLETLPLRIQRHSENALAVATWLQKDRRVEWVSYPGLETHSGAPEREEVPQGRVRRRAHVRREGRHARREGAHRPDQAVLPPGQRGRRQVAHHPSGVHHARAAHAGAAEGHRRHAGARAPLRRARKRQRSHRRSRPGPGRAGHQLRPPARPPRPRPSRRMHMSVTEELITANAGYAAGFTKGELPLPPARKVAIVTCMDARTHSLEGARARGGRRSCDPQCRRPGARCAAFAGHFAATARHARDRRDPSHRLRDADLQQ